MPVNPNYNFLHSPGNLEDKNQFLDFLQRDAMQKGMGANYGADLRDTQEMMNVLGAQNQQPVNRPAPRPVAPRPAAQRPMQTMASQPEEQFGIPSEPTGLVEPMSQMREEDLPPERQEYQGMRILPPNPDMPAQPQTLEESPYANTTMAKKAREMGFDPRQLLVALSEFSAGMGNIKGTPQQSSARSFYEMQKKYEGQDRDAAMREMRLAQPQVKTIDPLTEQYKQTQIDYLKSKMQPKPVAESDPLKQELLRSQIDYTKARQKKIETPDAQLPVAAGGEPSNSPKAIKMASELRKEYQNNAVTKATRDVRSQWNKVKQVLENPSAAGDMAAIFMFMKTLDPGSTVREGEYKNAAEATSARGRVETYANNVVNGRKLNPEQTLDFKRTMEKFYRAQMKEQERVNREYRDLAQRTGIDPRDLMIESEETQSSQKLRSVHDLPDAR